MKYTEKYRKWSVYGSELMFYFIGVSNVIWRHVATVPQNNDPSVAKGLNMQSATSLQFYYVIANPKVSE